MGNGARECEWCHAPEARGGFGGFGGFWKSQLSSWLGRRRLTFTSSPKPSQWHTCCGAGGRWKSQNRKNVNLCSYVEEPLNSKVIKRYCTWTKKSLRVFRVSGFLCFMYICYEHSKYFSHIHVWLCYIICDGVAAQHVSYNAIEISPWYI